MLRGDQVREGGEGVMSVDTQLDYVKGGPGEGGREGGRGGERVMSVDTQLDYVKGGPGEGGREGRG